VTGDGPPVRVRAAGIDDREIAAMAAAFAPADAAGGTPPAGCDDDLALRA
jgi:hypothetical protein